MYLLDSISAASLLATFDRAVGSALPAMALWFLVSGVDDLALFIAWAWIGIRGEGRLPDRREIATKPEQTLAVFVPLWHEHAVIRQMVTHNRSAVRYRNYHFFLGAYPNDTETLDVLRELETQYSNVHLALTPHDGPTSKADCLNWLYQSMVIHEERTGVQFAAIVIHDAEDLIHPDSFCWINWYLGEYDMVQIPVLPLETPLSDWIHGVYIDEFTENQARDLFVRCRMGGFLPSAGVGTAYSRRSLERMASDHRNRVFEPSCLTEDYENGFRVSAQGLRQILLPARHGDRSIVATREFFPRRMAAAIRQRTRWFTGIIWQGTERHGWQGGPRQWWWHWRDRKGLIGTPIAVGANLIFIYSVLTWLFAAVTGQPWSFGAYLDRLPGFGLVFTVALLQAGSRIVLVARRYNLALALAAPLRSPLANLINTVAMSRATWSYWSARWRREPLAWLKTAHQFPNRFTLEPHRPTLQEVLVRSAYCTAEQIRIAIASKPPGRRFEDWLVELDFLSESDLYEAISLQSCIPLVETDRREITGGTARSLPAHLLRKWRLVPVRRQSNELLLAGPELPPPSARDAIQVYTGLEVRFVLITPSNYRQLSRAVLPPAYQPEEED